MFLRSNAIRSNARIATLVLFAVVFAISLCSGTRAEPGQTQVPTTIEDFFSPGTQPNMLVDQLQVPINCGICHQIGDNNDGNPNYEVPPFNNWYLSMMAQAARDPVWHAALDIANQDAAFSGDLCIRCHSPNAWLNGRSTPTDASAFLDEDFEGISCHFCHRLVDPVAAPENPIEDVSILADLVNQGLLPTQPGNGRYVVDPLNVRRGPLDDVPANMHDGPILVSPFHKEAALCGTCHDVSNPAYTRQPDGTYALNAFNAAHPTGNTSQMMPEQRTYGEWLNSQFANTGVTYPDNRFGGEHPTGIMRSCQDCHMPTRSGGLCVQWMFKPFFSRPYIAEHSFIGANTWVLGAVFDLYGDLGYNLDEERVQFNLGRTQAMLQAASDMSVDQIGNQLKIRVINQSGHKLPTGYPEGRRIWINVKFFDALDALIAERGAYDPDTAHLTENDTTVYEAVGGIDSAVAAATGLSAGHTFHLVLNNVQLKDNRIPPRGFTNAAYDAIGAGYPAPTTYADGQFWDDTFFGIPRGTAYAVVTLNYQTTAKEYIEFLRDANTTTMNGQIAYNAWVARGKSAPVAMDSILIAVGNFNIADINHDGDVNIDDLTAVVLAWGTCPNPPSGLRCDADLDCDGDVDIDDLTSVILNWGA